MNEEIVYQLITICQLYLVDWNTHMDKKNNNKVVALYLLIMQLERSLTIASSQMMPKKPLAANTILKSLHEKKDLPLNLIMQIKVSLYLNVSRMIVKCRNKQSILEELELGTRMELLNKTPRWSNLGHEPTCLIQLIMGQCTL